MELTINGQVYKFNFGMGFLREINKIAKVHSGDIDKNVGFRYAVGGIIDREPETLVDVLYTANSGQDPRVTKEQLDSYIDNEDTDIEALFDTVMDFFKKTNATKSLTKLVLEALEAVEKEKKKTSQA